MGTVHDLVIIGAGAAGLTAGMYASRSNMDTVLLEKFAPGGQAALTAFVENFPGYPDGVSGFDLMENMRRHAVGYGLSILTTEVRCIGRFENSPFRISTTGGDIFTRTIIISTGVRPRFLDIPGEKEFFGRGVSTCATCDGAFYRDREVAVIGGGDSALDEGLYLTRFASKVHIIHRRDKFRAVHTLVEKARSHPKIFFRLESIVTAVKGNEFVEGVSLRHVKTGEESHLPVAGVFLYVGLIPNTGMFKGFLQLNEQGFILTGRELATSVPGIFAAGDVRDTPLRQIITAASDGALAAFSAGKYLEEHY
ncbi:MAG: thioredoxin-disulfide reductase [Candidatus Latescibacter sp.]|nr:thioredoxin-disulfide reductase [Candidatus Latescibacter sp.]